MSTSNQVINSSESRQRVNDFLSSHSVGVLATVDPNDDPHATTIYYACKDDFEVTFITKRGTKKHDNLQHNNHAVLVVYEPVSQTVAQVIGKVKEISDVEESDEAFSDLLQASMDTSEAAIPPISKLQAGGYIAYRIEPKEIRMAVFIRPDTGGYEKLYETIDFPDD